MGVFREGQNQEQTRALGNGVMSLVALKKKRKGGKSGPIHGTPKEKANVT